ncbi:MAG: ParM/StbA family protein [Oculatellaceae cyanobacterium Prado106]|jgi:hypothetical protein|nr:ParM/StbA family protein [Oculatellaceae cyanobacterium Prado106]
MKLPEVRIAFDPGSSLTKVVYSVSSALPQSLVMEPQILKLPTLLMTENQHSFSNMNPENQAWLQLDPKDEDCYIVGFLAQQYRASSRFDQVKHEQALHKLLAAVGVVAQREKAPRLELRVTTLLPYDEYQNRKQFEERAQQRLKQFWFRGQAIRTNLRAFYCSPEGGGVARKLRDQKGEAWFNSKTIAVLMFGHRNTSCLVFRRGRLDPNASCTSALGFVQLLQGIIKRTAGQNRDAIATTIFDLGTSPTPDHPLIRKLIRSTLPENME